MTISRTVVSLLFSLLLVGGSPTSTLAGEWRFQISGTTRTLRGIFTVNSSTTFVVGDSGLVMRTTDAGERWIVLPTQTTSNLYGAAFWNGLAGLVVGDNGTILQTIDGGATWQRRGAGVNTLLDAVAKEGTTGATAVGDSGVILHTTNQGLTWKRQQGGTTENLTGVAFASSLIAAVVSDHSSILHTSDAGSDWAQESDGGTPATLTGIAFGDSISGYAASAEGLVFRTNDAGVHWARVTDPPCCGSLNAVCSVSASTVTVVGGSGRIFRSTDDGISWSRQAANTSFGWTAASFLDDSLGMAVGSQGEIIRTVTGGGDSVVFPVFLSSPVNGALDELVEDPLRWHPFQQAVSYLVQVSTDSTFSAALVLNDSTVVDTFRYVSNLEFGKKHYWRVNAKTPVANDVLSSTWNFTVAAYPQLSVMQVQSVPADSLALADSLQSSGAARWSLQFSPYRNVSIRLAVVCVVGPGVVTLKSPAFIGHDTAASSGPWTGIVVEPDSGYLPAGFGKVKRGDVVSMRGVVDETPDASFNSMTVFKCRYLQVVDSSSQNAAPALVNISDFYSGSYPLGRVVYSRGEPYEGMVVELRHVVVSAALDTTEGTVVLTDDAANTLPTSDASRWFTFRARRDSLSHFSIPPAGSRIDTLRGLIIAGTSGGDGEADAGYRIAPLFPGDIVYNSHNGSLVSGSVFADLNGDSTRNNGEPGIPFQTVIVSGIVTTSTLADVNGGYSVDGLPAGVAVLSVGVPSGARLTLPSAGSYSVNLGTLDSVAGKNFGIHQSLNSIGGIVYDDVNENGQLDNGDVPLQGWRLELSGYISDSARTDSLGRFAFYRVFYGTSTVNVDVQSGWEQITPAVQQGYSFTIRALDQHLTGAVFGIHRIPLRVKSAMTVTDNTSFDSRTIWWGVRPGATYGIWGVDPSCTNADFSEGEAELPPEFSLFFDVRFADPTGSPLRFGNGSWTDMRQFQSSAQVDTYLIQFSPGRVDGGDYPMKFAWSHRQIDSLYGGTVLLQDRLGMVVDMKSSDTSIVTNANITSLLLIAQHPILPPEAVDRGSAAVPREFALEQNYPNPFNPVTTIRYDLPTSSNVSLVVYNLLGQEVSILRIGVESPGYKAVRWDASSRPSGIYFIRLRASSTTLPLKSFVEVRKMVVLK